MSIILLYITVQKINAKEEEEMKKVVMCSVVIVAILALAVAGIAKEAEKKSGEELFKQHCAACHPDGKNIINPKKTLNKKDLEANFIPSFLQVVGEIPKTVSEKNLDRKLREEFQQGGGTIYKFDDFR